MHIFKIDAADFYKKYNPESLAYYERVKNCMDELIKHCNLSEKSILSIGAGTAHEEYFFYKNGARLTIVDIDEHNSILNALRKLESHSEVNMTYAIGDATKEELPFGKYDALYFSGFTPDELRRDKIRNIARKLQSEFKIPIISSKMCNQLFWTAARPFHKTITSYIEKYLSSKGYVIIQSYCGGVDVNSHKGYIDAAISYFNRLDLHLLEVFSFSTCPSVMLYIASRNVKTKQKNLTNFHGRSELDREIIKIL